MATDITKLNADPMPVEATENSLRAGLPQSIGCLVRREAKSVFPEGRWSEVVEYLIVRDCPPEARGDLERAVEMFENACKPWCPERLGVELVRMYRQMAHRQDATQEDFEFLIAGYHDDLSGYPADVVLEVLREYRRGRHGKWFPTSPELVRECHERSQRRRSMLRALRELRDRADGGEDRERVLSVVDRVAAAKRVG